MLEFRYIKNRFWQTFVLCLLVAALMLLPLCLRDAMQGRFFLYAGDYNSQTILFNQYMNAFVKEGGTFSWETDLGSGFVNAYTYYGLGTVFFWITLILPSRLAAWALPVLICVKFAIAGSGAYLWAKRYVKDPRYAMLAGMLYAFSGYTVYSIFFYAFLDVIAIFPYVLASLDDALFDDRHGPFPFWLAISLLNNYYFFYGMAIFLVIYLVCQILGGRCHMTKRLFLRMVLETVLGVLMGCALFVPAVVSTLQNPRVSSLLNGYGFINYSAGQQYVAILESLFLMPDAPYGRTLFPDADVKWRNLTAYLPVVGITGGLAICRVKRNHPFSRLLRFSLICAFIPALNQVFNLFNEVYYARWFYMPILILCGATVLSLEDEEINRAGWKGAWRTVFAFTLGFAALGLVPETVAIFGTQLGVANAYYFWPLWGVSMGGVVLGGILYKKYYRTQKFLSAMMFGVLVFSFVFCEVHLMMTKYEAEQDGENDWYNGLADCENLKEWMDSDEFARIDQTDESNYSLVVGRSGECFFSTTVSPGIYSFYQGLGISRVSLSETSQSLYALRSLLSTRYLLINPDEEESWCGEEASGSDLTLTSDNKDEFISELAGEGESDTTYIRTEWADNWEEIGRTDSFIVYENVNFISMGFTYDYYITQEQYEESDLETRSNLLLKALVLTDEQVEAYGDLLEPLPKEEFDNCTYDAFVEDCAERNRGTVESFDEDNYGFTATTDYEEEELVFFSVPYEENAFTATVNGEPVEVEEVDEGLMAIHVPAGACTIRVDYHTPGLRTGIAVTLLGVAGYIGYLLFWRRRKKDLPQVTEEEAKNADSVSGGKNTVPQDADEASGEEDPTSPEPDDGGEPPGEGDSAGEGEPTGEGDSPGEKEEATTGKKKTFRLPKVDLGGISDRKLLVMAIVLTVVVYVIVSLATEMVYHSNDDERIQAVLSGYWTGSPYAYHPFIHVLLSHFLAALYALFPKLQWWWVWSHALMAVGMTLTHYGVLKIAKKGGASVRALTVWLVLLEVGFFMYCVEYVAYTVVGAILGTGLIAVLFCLADAKSDKLVRGGVIAVFCGYLVVLMNRKQTGYVLLCYILLICLYVILSRCENVKQAVKKFALTAGVFIVATVALVGVNTVAQTKENGEAFMEYDAARIAYRDYPRDSYENNPELYESVGWDEVTWYLVENWCFLDDDVTAENLEYLAEQNHNTAERTLDTMKSLMSSWRSRSLLLLWLTSAGAGLMFSFCARNKKDVYFALLNHLGTIALFGFQLVRGRVNYRSLVILLIPAFVINVIFLLKNRKEANMLENLRLGRIILGAVGVYAFAFAFMATFNVSNNALMAYYKQRTTQVYEYFEAHTENFYVTQFQVTDYINPWRLTQGTANNIQWGGAMYGTASARKLLAANGISELTGETFKEDNVYFVSLADALDTETAEERTHLEFTVFYRWLEEEYGAIGFVQEGEIADGVWLYHFVFPENMDDYDTFLTIE